MSSRKRTNKNRNAGRDYWGKRPGNESMCASYPKRGGKFHKKRTHKLERQAARHTGERAEP